MQGWRVLDATSFSGVVSAKRGALTLTEYGADKVPTSVPAEEVAVLLIGLRTTVTAAALHRLADHDIALLSCDWRGVPLAGLYPWSDHGRVAARHIAQAELSRPRKKNAWKQVVQAKIAGQAATLRTIDQVGADRLASMARAVRSGDPSNAEGTAARLYWPRLFVHDDDEFRRNPEAQDLRNAQLNYGYMVLRGYGVRAVLSAGLSPPLGLFHHGRSNFFNLVDDLIEPFRPAVDAVVATLSSNDSLDDAEVKKVLVSAANQPFDSEGYRIPSVLVDLAQQLGRYVEGEVDKLIVPTWHGNGEVQLVEKPDTDDPELDWHPPW